MSPASCAASCRESENTRALRPLELVAAATSGWTRSVSSMTTEMERGPLRPQRLNDLPLAPGASEVLAAGASTREWLTCSPVFQSVAGSTSNDNRA